MNNVGGLIFLEYSHSSSEIPACQREVWIRQLETRGSRDCGWVVHDSSARLPLTLETRLPAACYRVMIGDVT